MKETTNLVRITEEEFDVILDLRYATENNVCNRKLYSKPVCYLYPETAENLKKAVKISRMFGYRIKIFDGFRPIEVQKFMFDKFPDAGFISNPENGAIPHCRGVAIDLTLTDLDGNEIEMGSDFDEFSEIAFHNCQTISKEAQKNRIILLGIMTSAGFDFFSQEWWHYQLFKPREYNLAQAPEIMVNV